MKQIIEIMIILMTIYSAAHVVPKLLINLKQAELKILVETKSGSWGKVWTPK